MTILKKAVMQDGTKIQLEDWSRAFPSDPRPVNIGAYPRSHWSKPARWTRFYPVQGQTFRLTLEFTSMAEAERVFGELQLPGANLLDFADYVYDDANLECLQL